METTFFEGSLPPGYRCEFDPFVFNAPENLLIQSAEGWQSFYAMRDKKNVVRARVHFHVSDHTAVSPFKNPFGSYEFAETFERKELYEFIRWTENKLKEKNVKRIEIKNYPDLYHNHCSSVLSTFLFNHGYRVCNAELSACIKVEANKLYEVMSSWERRKSGQLKRSSLRFGQVPLQKLRDVYDFIGSCREERHQALSMTYGQLQMVCNTLADSFRLFTVHDGSVFAAAAICILINKSILYTFYYAHSREYDALSPVVKLAEGIYEFCKHEKIKIIDLGTSALDGKPNFSLLDFKLRLGAVPTQKLTFEKLLT